jgi:hypothetical protein
MLFQLRGQLSDFFRLHADQRQRSLVGVVVGGIVADRLGQRFFGGRPMQAMGCLLIFGIRSYMRPATQLTTDH